MSSILRALKKLEEGDSSEQKTTIKRMVSRRTRRPGAFIRFLYILLPILLVGTAALIIVNSIREPSITKKQDTSSKKSPITHLTQKSPRLKKEIKKESTKESTAPAISHQQSKPTTTPPIAEIDRSPRPGGAKEPIRATVGKEIAPATTPEQELEKENKPPDFTLNGVLWSDKRERRVALIDDRYLKEGEEIISGVVIIKIEKKAVILQAGEKKWTIHVKK